MILVPSNPILGYMTNLITKEDRLIIYLINEAEIMEKGRNVEDNGP